MTYPRFLGPKTSAQEDIDFFFFFFQNCWRTHRVTTPYFWNYVPYIVSVFALAEIIKKKKQLHIGYRKFSPLFKKKKKKKKKFISIGPLVFGLEIKTSFLVWE